MSESTIPVTISHDGEYCGECKFLHKWITAPNFVLYECCAYRRANMVFSDKAKRCNACIEKAIPVEEKPAVMIISNPDLDPAEAEAMVEYARFRFPERFKNG